MQNTINFMKDDGVSIKIKFRKSYLQLFAILATWSVGDREVVCSELMYPSRLTSIERLGGREVFQVLVISDDLDRGWGSF